MEYSDKPDLWDRRILYELDCDARASFSEIGRKVKRSPQWVKYRVERLRKLGAIKHLYPIIDYSRLGYLHAGLWLKLADATPAEEGAFLNDCYKESAVQVVYRTEGEYDLFLGVFAQGLPALEGFISRFKEAHGAIISSLDFSLATSSCKFRRHYLLGGKPGDESGIMVGAAGKAAKADEGDLFILECLNADPRMGIIEMARKTGMGKDAVIYRLRSLKKDKVLLGCTLQVNFRNLPVQSYAILLRTAGMGQEKRAELQTFCRLSGKAVRLHSALGSYDFMIELEDESRDACRWFYKELCRRFAKSLRGSSMQYIYSLDKHRLFPTGIGGK
jgi:DNA-binding Lrp family transcriptional regulator